MNLFITKEYISYTWIMIVWRTRNGIVKEENKFHKNHMMTKGTILKKNKDFK